MGFLFFKIYFYLVIVKACFWNFSIINQQNIHIYVKGGFFNFLILVTVYKRRLFEDLDTELDCFIYFQTLSNNTYNMRLLLIFNFILLMQELFLIYNSFNFTFF